MNKFFCTFCTMKILIWIKT